MYSSNGLLTFGGRAKTQRPPALDSVADTSPLAKRESEEFVIEPAGDRVYTSKLQPDAAKTKKKFQRDDDKVPIDMVCKISLPDQPPGHLSLELDGLRNTAFETNSELLLPSASPQSSTTTTDIESSQQDTQRADVNDTDKLEVSGTQELTKKKNLYFHNYWVLWSHEISDEDYSIQSYRIVWETNNMVDFLNKINAYSEDEWSTKMFFFMRRGITPRYEDPKNVRGGSWSFRVNKNYCYTSWVSLCLQCMGECLIESWDEMKRINGISLSPKNNTTTVRIWNEVSACALNLQHQVPNIDQNKAIFRAN